MWNDDVSSWVRLRVSGPSDASVHMSARRSDNPTQAEYRGLASDIREAESSPLLAYNESCDIGRGILS